MKAAHSKDARIQHKQISLYIQLLQDNGTRLNENITKHIEDDIWELRPGNNRVFYFFYKDNTFVLLHQFRKKTQKTPKREIEKAKAELAAMCGIPQSSVARIESCKTTPNLRTLLKLFKHLNLKINITPFNPII